MKKEEVFPVIRKIWYFKCNQTVHSLIPFTPAFIPEANKYFYFSNEREKRMCCKQKSMHFYSVKALWCLLRFKWFHYCHLSPCCSLQLPLGVITIHSQLLRLYMRYCNSFNGNATQSEFIHRILLHRNHLVASQISTKSRFREH